MSPFEGHQDAQALNRIVAVLQNAQNPDSDVQREVVLAVQQLMADADCARLLTILFGQLPDSAADVRFQAGLLLKNHLLKNQQPPSHRRPLTAGGGGASPFGTALVPGGETGGQPKAAGGEQQPLGTIPAEVMILMKETVLAALSSPVKIIRSTAGTLVTTIVVAEGPGRWRSALSYVVRLLDSADADTADSAFSTLLKITEDELNILTEDSFSIDDPAVEAGEDGGGRTAFLEFSRTDLLPKLFHLLSAAIANKNTTIQHHIMQCLNLFSQSFSLSPGEPLEAFFPQYWAALGTLAGEAGSEIRPLVVAGMLSVMDYSDMTIMCDIESVIKFIVDCCGDQDYRVRLDALEFWVVALRCRLPPDPIIAELPRLLPCLVESTKYSKHDYLQMDASQLEGDNAETPDDAKDIIPRFHQQRQKQDDGDDDDGEDTHKLWGSNWTVRKAAALALDLLSTELDSKFVLPHVLPLVESRLMAADWELRESAVLTLGAISQGCMKALSPYLPNVLDVLLRLFDDPRPLLRSISAWCVSRFAHWACLPENVDSFVQPILARVLKLTLDRNKGVQEAAISAFAAIEEEARTLLVPYLDDICSTLASAFRMYQTGNMVLLYDAVGTLADSVGYHLAAPLPSEKILVPFFKRFEMTSDLDPSFVPMLECLSCLSYAIKEAVVPYANYVLRRCSNVIRAYLVQTAQRRQYDEAVANAQSLGQPLTKMPEPSQSISKDSVDTALDTISAIVEALGPKTAEAIGQPQDDANFLGTFEGIFNEPTLQRTAGTNVSAFALLGIVAKTFPQQLEPYYPTVMPKLVASVTHDSSSVVNNATWALGIIALSGGGAVIEPFMDGLMERMSRVLLVRARVQSLLETMCFTVSRLGLACPAKAAQYLALFIRPWCIILSSAANEEEKELALRGICAVISSNHHGISEHIHPLLEFIASFYPPPYDVSASSSRHPSAAAAGDTPQASGTVGRSSSSASTANAAVSAGSPAASSTPPPPPPKSSLPPGPNTFAAESAAQEGNWAHPRAAAARGNHDPLSEESLAIVRSMVSFLESTYPAQCAEAWGWLSLATQQTLREKLAGQ